MNLKYLLLLIMAVLLLNSCEDKPDPNKDETTTVNGTVVEYGTNKPIEGAVVKMLNREAGRDTVAKTVTDANGRFSYSYKGPISFGLCSYVYKDQYFTEQGADGPGTDKMCHRWGVENNPVLTAKPYAWIKLHVLSLNGNTSIHINPPIGSEKSGISLSGSIGDTSVYFRMWGNYYDDLNIFIYKDSDRETKAIPIYAPGHDTTFYEIKY